MPDRQIFIRRATSADTQYLNHICLLTGDAGKSAEEKYTLKQLPGLLWADPYVNCPSATGFVLVDHRTGEEDEKVVGYILVAFDTVSFERELEEDWFPQWRVTYPNPYVPPDADSPSPTESDLRVLGWIHKPYKANAAELAFSPAHMHIDILPEYQGQGWGKKMVGKLVEFLREEKGLKAVWLGLDLRNENAKRFYGHLGFKAIQGAAEHMMGLNFSDWKDI
ncbi:Acyl-CoA N-acyltransferase [Abortiporus biennis]